MADATGRMERDRCAVYIDGLNLYNSALRHSTSRWLDIDAIDEAAELERRVMVRLPEEKMTDVALAVAMVNDFHLGRCEQTVLVANDADYRPALETLADLGHRIQVISPARNVNKKLRDDRWRATTLDLGLLKSCELPDSFVAGEKTFERPKHWR